MMMSCDNDDDALYCWVVIMIIMSCADDMKMSCYISGGSSSFLYIDIVDGVIVDESEVWRN